MKNIKTLKYYSLYIFAFIILMFSKCTEKFMLDLPPNSQKLVVECDFLDIDTVHYLRLTLSKASFSETEMEKIGNDWRANKFESVSDAHVVISDDIGNTYTYKGGADSIYVPSYVSGKDSVWRLNEYSLSKGYYILENVIPTPGRTYSLKIEWKDKIYTSSCYMHITPQIDSVGYAYKQGETGKNNYYIPYLWFKDNPNTEDYYLFKTSEHSRIWAHAILSDKFIQSDVAGINVFRGETVDYWMNAYPDPGMDYKIEMYSVSHEIYNYYKSLINQFRSDGGVLQPSPAPPPSNISNGALGYFNAASVRVFKDRLPHDQ